MAKDKKTKTTKTTKTYSIDINTYELFDQVAKKNNINKSSLIENCVKQYLTDNLGYNTDERYYSVNDKDNIVTIVDKDDTYFKLSDGRAISQILFYQTFKKA